ncbi:hypothetical protein LEP1GSC170_5616 [Leptospira interrogans serovar Bataviae str. HAI135]|nr:hypothetical protein LEP1GSC170_5616 [Leptospira interrogans serovar Bataviae str. HAI135]
MGIVQFFCENIKLYTIGFLYQIHIILNFTVSVFYSQKFKSIKTKIFLRLSD